MNKLDYNYKKLAPFKLCVLENFPFIEADFDALTNYQLLCKIVEYINEVAKNNDVMLDNVEALNNWFNNLDVQEEINNKLDQMAESGQLSDIITQYLQVSSILAFNTVADMKSSTNLSEGSFAETYGFYSVADGGSAKYKIRKITNIDVIDNIKLFALDNDSTLVAELIINKEMNSKQFGLVGDGETDETTKLKEFFENEKIEKYILLDGTYILDDDIRITNNSNIEFMENAIIKRKATSNTNYYMLNVGNVSHVLIRNAHLIGDKDDHTGTTGEWGYGIHVFSSQYINIENAIIEKTWGDGIYVGFSYAEASTQIPKYITIDNAKILNCSRNGISICGGEDIIVSNSYIYGTTRTNPKAGIDIEPEAPDSINPYLKNVTIDNIITEANIVGIGLTTNKQIENLTINNHSSNMETEGFVVYNIENDCSVVYQNAHIIKCYDAGVIVTKKKNSVLTLKNIVIDSFRKTNLTHGWDGAIIIKTDSENDGNLIIDNIEVLKSYDTLFIPNDIIIERGTGVFDGLTIKNINTTLYLTVNNAININLTNSKFILSSIYYTIDVNKYRIHNYMINPDALQVNTTRNIGQSLPDGDYEVILNNNVGGYILSVIFDSTLNVFNTSTYGETGKTYKAGYRAGYLKFNKTGSVINIIINSGFDVS